MQEIWVQSLGWEDPQRRERLPTPVFWPGEFYGLYSPWSGTAAGAAASWCLSGGCGGLEWLEGDTPCPRAKEKPQQDGRRGEIAFRIKLHTRQRRSEGSNKPCTNQDPETPQRLRQNCVWVSPGEVRVSSGLLWGQGLWVQQTWVWHKPSWRRSPLTHHRAARTYTGLGKLTLGRHKQNLVHQEKGAVTPQGTDPDFPACPGVSGGSKF